MRATAARRREMEIPSNEPRAMVVAPALPAPQCGHPLQPRYALLINPFYPKDPRASYGKHVLTPSLALTSIAGATPANWEVRYWDENLLQGPPPVDPVPQVVGITVHLTFARRAYQLADWFRQQGCCVVLGGLHVLSCPEEAAQHADAIAIGDGVQLWPRIYRMREVQQVVDEIVADRQPYTVFIDNNLGSRPTYLRSLCAALRPLEIIWSAAVTIDVTDDPTLVRDMALAGCTGVFVGFESLNGGNLTDSRKKTPVPEDYARRVALFHRYGIQVNGSFVLGFDHDRPDVFERTVEWVEANRLECATFHILTPYPGTPLFRQMESQRRILHRTGTSTTRLTSYSNRST